MIQNNPSVEGFATPCKVGTLRKVGLLSEYGLKDRPGDTVGLGSLSLAVPNFKRSRKLAIVGL